MPGQNINFGSGKINPPRIGKGFRLRMLRGVPPLKPPESRSDPMFDGGGGDVKAASGYPGLSYLAANALGTTKLDSSMLGLMAAGGAAGAPLGSLVGMSRPEDPDHVIESTVKDTLRGGATGVGAGAGAAVGAEAARKFSPDSGISQLLAAIAGAGAGGYLGNRTMNALVGSKRASLPVDMWITADLMKDASWGRVAGAVPAAWGGLKSLFGGAAKAAPAVAESAAPAAKSMLPMAGNAAAGAGIAASQAAPGDGWTAATGGAVAGALGGKFAPKTTMMASGLGGAGSSADYFINKSRQQQANAAAAAESQQTGQTVAPKPIQQSRLGTLGVGLGLGLGGAGSLAARRGVAAAPSVMNTGATAAGLAGGAAAAPAIAQGTGEAAQGLVTNTLANASREAFGGTLADASKSVGPMAKHIMQSPEGQEIIGNIKQEFQTMKQQFGDELSNRIKQAPNDMLSGIFDTTGLGKLLGFMGVNHAEMQPWQKALLLFGILGGAGGMMGGGKMMGGAGLLGILGAFGPQLMQGFQQMRGQQPAAGQSGPVAQPESAMPGSNAGTGMSVLDSPYPSAGERSWNLPSQ